MYSRISRRKIIKKKAQKWGKTQINALSPYGNVSFERDKDKSVLFFTQRTQRAQNFHPHFYSTLALEGRKLRYNGSVGVKYILFSL